jgi:hypothetical protein
LRLLHLAGQHDPIMAGVTDVNVVAIAKPRLVLRKHDGCACGWPQVFFQRLVYVGTVTSKRRSYREHRGKKLPMNPGKKHKK